MERLQFKVSYNANMINIDSNYKDIEGFSYSNIQNLYKNNRNGHGIQVNDLKNEENLKKMCEKISEVIYEFIDNSKK